MTPRALLVDLDNTLVDRDAAFAAWLATFAPPDTISRLTAVDHGGYGAKPALYTALAAAVGVPLSEARRRFLRDFPTFSRLRADADALLRHFSGPVVVVTNGPSELQRGKLAATGLDARVQGIVVSEEVGVEKPDAAMFHAGLALAGCAPEHALMLGDHPVNDIDGAQALGIPAVFVRSPWFTDPPGVPAITHLTELPFLARRPTPRGNLP